MGAIPALQSRLSDHPLAFALVIYSIVAIPILVWLIGPVGDAGEIDASVAIGAILMGTLMFVPALTAKLKRTYGGGQAQRLGFLEGDS